ncbi:MAG: hypothetical protein C0462_07105 [Alcanivorax sp.]|nr:hypothetical protein [Alcanivorax sp.]
MPLHFLSVILISIAGAVVTDGCRLEVGSRGQGEASFAITDAPADDVDQVRLTVTAIHLGHESGDTVRLTLDPPVVIDNLLDLQGTQSQTLFPLDDVRSGDYEWIRLLISERNGDSEVRERIGSGGTFPLRLGTSAPGNSTRFLQLDTPFRINANRENRFTLDVDLRRGLIRPTGENFYLLRPTLRLVRNNDAGVIEGTVADSLIQNSNCTSETIGDELAGNAVYLYQGSITNPGDINVGANGQPVTSPRRNPITTANVRLNNGQHEYKFGFIPEGSYTIAFTCRALDDRPNARDDGVTFSGRTNVTVTAGETIEVDFSGN